MTCYTVNDFVNVIGVGRISYGTREDKKAGGDAATFVQATVDKEVTVRGGQNVSIGKFSTIRCHNAMTVVGGVDA